LNLGSPTTSSAVAIRLNRSQSLVATAAQASGMVLSSYVDRITSKGSLSYFAVINGQKVLNIGSNTFRRTNAGQLMEAAHELVHAEQFDNVVKQYNGNVNNAWSAFTSSGFGSPQYAIDEVEAETLVPLAGSFSACSARYNVRDDSSKRLLNVRNHFQRRVLALERVTKYRGGVSPQQVAASTRYIEGWKVIIPPLLIP